MTWLGDKSRRLTMENLQQVLKKTYDLVKFTNYRNFTVEGVLQEPIKSLSVIDRRNGQLIQHPDKTEIENRGSCYDQSFLVKKWMDGIGIENKVFHSVTNNLPIRNGVFHYSGVVTSHTFILCRIDGTWKWVEWSWYANIKNNFEGNDIETVLNLYTEMAEKSWHFPIHLCEVTSIELPMPRLYFLNHCMSLPNIAKKP